MNTGILVLVVEPTLVPGSIIYDMCERGFVASL